MNRIAFLLMFFSFCSEFSFGQDPVGARRFSNQMMHDGAVNTVVFSPDGSKIISGGLDGLIKIWDVSSKREIRRLEHDYSYISNLCFSPNGKKIICTGSGYISLWDVNSGVKIKSFSITNVSSVYLFEEKIIYALNDGKICKLDIIKNEYNVIYDFKCKIEEFRLSNENFIVGSNDSIKIYNKRLNRLISFFPGIERRDNIVDIAIKGDSIAISCDFSIAIWDINFGKVIEKIRKAEYDRKDIGLSMSLSGETYSGVLIFAPNGRGIISAQSDNFIHTYDGSGVIFNGNHNDDITSLSTNPKGTMLASASKDGTIKLWSLLDGKNLTPEEGHSGNTTHFSINSNGKMICSGSSDKTIKIWDIENGKELENLSGHFSRINSLSYNQDGKKIVSSDGYETILWDLEKKTNKKFENSLWDVECSINPTNNKILTTTTYTVVVADIENSKKTELFPTGAGQIITPPLINSDGKQTGLYISPSISPDGNLYSFIKRNNKVSEVYFYNSDLIKVEKQLSGINSSIGRFSFDSKFYILNDSDGFRIFNIEQNKIFKKFEDKNTIVDLCLSKDMNFIISGHFDGTIKLWDITSEKILKIWKINERPKRVFFSENDEKITITTYRYWVNFDLNNNINKTNNSTKVYLTTPNPRKYNPLKANQEKLNIEAIISTPLEEKQLREAIQVRVNGTLQTGKLGDVSLKSQQQEYDFEQSVQLEEGANKIEIIIAAPNQEVVKSIPLNVFYTPPQKANLYLFTFGVQFLDLDYTDEDATVIHQLFSSQRGLLFNQIFSEQPLINNNTNADAIGKEFERLGNRDDIREQDVVLVFGSSHGGIFNDKFRIYGRDFEDTAPRKTTIDFNEDIIANLDKLNCKKVILLDACRSGASVGKSKTDANTLIANTPPGTVIITSSSKTERSYENEAWQNSSFVKAIKEGLEEAKANTDGDGYVTIKELFNYLQKRVPSLVKSVKSLENLQQNPQMKMENLQDFPIYKVK